MRQYSLGRISQSCEPGALHAAVLTWKTLNLLSQVYGVNTHLEEAANLVSLGYGVSTHLEEAANLVSPGYGVSAHLDEPGNL
jgi:hypothetical protein